MGHLLEEESVDIYYDKEVRKYAIGMKNGTSAVQTMYFCPWCGAKLPKDLIDEWFDILENEYKIDLSTGSEKHKIPDEFKTDEWWKKRGL